MSEQIEDLLSRVSALEQAVLKLQANAKEAAPRPPLPEGRLIRDLDFGSRLGRNSGSLTKICNALIREDIHTVDELLSLDPLDLLHCRNIGEGGLRIIAFGLSEEGCELPQVWKSFAEW